MLSEVSRKRLHDVAFLEVTPTASSKTKARRTATSQHTQVNDEYKTKAMAEWKYADVVNFSLEGRMTDLDFDFSSINGITGTEFATMPMERFIRLSSKYGHELYKLVQRRVQQEKGAARQPFPATSPSTPSPSAPTITSSPSSPLFSPPYILTSPHNHLSQHQPSIRCDAAAPYELRIEAPPSQHPLRFPGSAVWPDMFSSTPTAALKKSPPALMAIDATVRDGRRDVTADSDAGRGSGGGGEQGRPAPEEVKVEKKRGPGRPRKPENELKKKKKKTGRLWEFIRNLLLNPETCPSLVRWENAEEGLFRFIDGEKVAKRWGDRKQNKDMNYEKLSRAMRYYYKTHIFEAVLGRRLVYKFGKKATGWRTANPNFAIPPDHSTSQEPPPPPQQPPPPPQQPPPPPINHHTKPSLQHYADTKPQLHHHTDTQPTHHHQNSPPHHQPEQKFLSSLHQDSSTASHLHHTHPLQGLTLHHHHPQHPHHTT